jgi:hypothetical protein
MEFLHGLGLIGGEVGELLVLVRVDPQLRDRRLLLRNLRSTRCLVYWLSWCKSTFTSTKKKSTELLLRHLSSTRYLVYWLYWYNSTGFY